MPKRKTSHDYCRVRFGIFKRRRVSTGNISSECNDDDCCEVRVRRHKNNELLYHHYQHNLTSMTSVSTCHNNPRPPVYFQHFSVGSPSLKCLWSSGDCSDSSGANVFQPSKLLPTIVDTCNSILSNNSTNCSDTNNSRTTMLQLQPVQSYSKLPTDSDDRFQKVMNLVALTSSLKLSEDNTKNHSSCQSSDLSDGDSHKEQMELTQSKPSAADTTCSSVMSDLANNFWNESSASSNSCFGFTVDFKTEGTSYAPHLMSRIHSHNAQTEHSVHSSSPSPILNRSSPDDSSDSDEGFCEPVSKRFPQFTSDSITQPDKEMNLFESNHTLLLNRSKYTNHLVNSSSSCNLYWQMMSNLYGIPTKISYPTERSCITSSTPGVEIKSAQHSRCITSWTRNEPFVIKLYEDKLVARKSQEESCTRQQSGVQIFAVGKLVPELAKVEGTLDLALQHAINSNTSVLVFDCEIGENAVENGTCEWYRYCHEQLRFLPCHCIPVLKQNFAGICTNELPQAGRMAIKALFQRTFGSP